MGIQTHWEYSKPAVGRKKGGGGENRREGAFTRGLVLVYTAALIYEGGGGMRVSGSGA